MYWLSHAQFALNRLEDAASSLEAATRLSPDDEYPQFLLAAVYGLLGREREARQALDRYNDIVVA
jgi:Flp pilus assembly protein TadD